MGVISTFRKFAEGKINESTLQSAVIGDNSGDDISEYENDVEFMQECTEDCMGLIIESMILGEYAEQLDENVNRAIVTLRDYFVGQGLISEAATVSLNNPKINVVRMNKQSQIKRLASIITLKMGRKANHKAYKKYKLGQKIRKNNMAELKKLYWSKAERLAKKLWQRTHKSGKVNAVVSDNKK